MKSYKRTCETTFMITYEEGGIYKNNLILIDWSENAAKRQFKRLHSSRKFINAEWIHL